MALLHTAFLLLLHSATPCQAFHLPPVTWIRPNQHALRSDPVFSTPKDAQDTDDAAAKPSRDFWETNAESINDFCIGTNEFWKKLVIKPVRDYVEIQPAGTADSKDILAKLIAPPEVPGIPRPVWLVILGSVPTALGWYGYYKFSVEEELYQYELQKGKPVTGCGGYGTLFPFVYGAMFGFPLSLLPLPGSNLVLEAAALWILLGQVNLYRRVNQLYTDPEEEAEAQGAAGEEQAPSLELPLEPPLYTWWALLPPPLDVVVGLRQVHFLSEFWRRKRGEPYDKDVVAEELFPFISAPRFTLKTFFRTPSMWFWFTSEWKDFDSLSFLKEDDSTIESAAAASVEALPMNKTK